jgi:hypothetical protein
LDSQGPVEQIFQQQPLALKNLLGEERHIQFQINNSTITLTLKADNELATRMSLDLGIEITIVGNPYPTTEEARSNLWLRCHENDYEKIANYLNNNQLVWQIATPKSVTSAHLN